MSLPEYVHKTGPSPYPERVIFEQGLQDLPPTIEDESTKSAHNCLRKLFARFDWIKVHEAAVNSKDQTLSDRRKGELFNQIRRQIAPSAFLIASYLLQRSVYYFKANETDSSTLPLAMNMQDIMQAIKENQSVKDFLRPFTFETIPGEISREPVTVRGLPELKATISTSAISLDFDFHSPVESLETLKLAKLQWTAVRIFVSWYESRGQSEFVVVELAKVSDHLKKIEYAIAQIEKTLAD